MKTRIASLTVGLMFSSLCATYADTLPVITQSATNQTVVSGATVVLAVTATGSNLQYEWEYNGDVVPGATGSILTLTNLTKGDCGAYRAIVFNSAGLVNSANAYVLLAAPALPFADNFASRGVINTALGIGNGYSAGATKETGEPKPCNGPVGKSVWITWVAPSNGIALFDTIGSAFDTVLGVYTGTNLTSLVEVASDDDTGELHSSYIAFNATAGKSYQIYLGSLDHDGGAILLSWSMLLPTFPWPTNVIQLTNVTTLPGGAATLTVQFTSASPLTVQWYHNGLAMPGATNQTSVTAGTKTTLSWSQLTEADLGVYQVALSSPLWTWFLNPAEIQFNSQGIPTAGARNKFSDLSH